MTDTTIRTQATPTANTWYNPGGASQQISVPIGAWNLSYKALVECEKQSATQSMACTLSTANNSDSDTDFTLAAEWNAAATTARPNISAQVTKPVTVASKTTYYLNVQVNNASIANLWVRADMAKVVLRAVCAYL